MTFAQKSLSTDSPDRSSGGGALALQVTDVGTVPGGEGTEPIKILIVDDEEKNLTVLEAILHHPDYALVRARSADEALLALIAGQFAVLILDIRMPGMTGLELAEVIKQRKKTAQVPIIFLTAYYNEDQHVIEGYGTGAVDYLQKPVNPQILRSKVAVFAELHRKSRDAAAANRALSDEVAERRVAQEKLRDLNETLEQRVAERTEELRQANRLKDEFLAMLGHELRNPLAAITNAVKVANIAGADATRSSWALSLVERQTKNLRRIVDDLLDVARVTRGKIDLRKERLDVVQVVRQAIDVVLPMLNAAEEIRLAVGTDTPLRVDADGTRLEQCIVNLLLNAIKFTPQARQIEVGVTLDDLEIVIEVADNGIGIPSHLLKSVFELFTQADNSLDRSSGGLGIGLFICKRLVEMHGGTIKVSSSGPGLGATFSIRLPVLQEPALERKTISPSADDPVGVNSSTARRVLVVDDNMDSAATLSWLLADRGFDVRIAHDGASGLRAAEEFQPEILLLDIGLPGIDGYEMARRLRSNGFAGAYLIAISGYALENDIERSRLAGFDRHLSKPVEIEELVAAFVAIGSGASAP